MTTIISKTKEIVVARVEQQTITKLVIDADYKVLSFYTQFSDAQVVVMPMIHKMETVDLIAPQVAIIDADEFIQVTQKIHDTLNESGNQFKVFLQEVMKMVSSIASVTP